MTFSSYPQIMSTILFDGNETVQVASFDPPENISLDALELFVYRQGKLSPAQFSLSVTGTNTNEISETVLLSDLSLTTGDNYLGKVRVNFPVKPNLNNGTTYTVSLTISGYNPVIDGLIADQKHFSLLQDWPITMAYNSTMNAGQTAPIAMHIFGEK